MVAAPSMKWLRDVTNMTQGVASAFHGETILMGGCTHAPAKLATGTYTYIIYIYVFL